MYVTIYIYNILDGYQTILLLNLGATEINPVINYFIKLTDNNYNVIYLVKSGVLMILGILLIIYL